MAKKSLSVIQQGAKPKHAHPADVVAQITPADVAGATVCFINMPLRESAPPTTTPEGPIILATILRQRYGVEARVMDINGYRIKDAESARQGLTHGRHLTKDEIAELIVKDFSVYGVPTVVALSGLITTLRWQEYIAQIIRKNFPGVFLVSGGGLATELKLGLLNYIPELDAVAHSEGDDVAIKIVYDAHQIKLKGLNSALTDGKLSPYYQGYIKGRHRFLYAGDRPRDLDALPFADLELIREDVFGRQVLETYITTPVWGGSANNSSATSFVMARSTTAVSSRGCPYACEFCYRGAQGERNWGMRSAQNMADHYALHVQKYGIDFMGFPDDNFAIHVKRCHDLADAFAPLQAAGITPRWGTHLRLDESADLRPDRNNPGTYKTASPLRIESMAKSGCIYIGFGAESASPKVLDEMQKGGFILTNGTTPIIINGRSWDMPLTMIEGIRNCEYTGIHANCTWIMGFPTETLEDLKQSIAFIKWQEDFYSSCGKPISSVNKKMFTATWYPGTEMIRHPKVRSTLEKVFGLTFDPITHEPICDDAFHNYMLELDDATKLLTNPTTGEPLNFGDMPDDQFLQARELIDTGKIFEVLDL